MTNKPIAIIGAGNGGQTTAAWLANQGYKTRIFDVMEDTVAKLNELGGVNIYGNTDYPGFGKIEFATTDMEKAIEGCELILLILPENYHDSIAVKMAPYLKDGQIVVLNPASGLGAISFKKALTDAGCTVDVTLAVTCTLLFAARIKETGDVLVTGQKTELSIVAFPGNRKQIVEDAMYPVFSQHIFANNIIDTAMENLNLAFHPGPTLLYTSLIERGITFDYYNSMTPSQIKLIKAIDKERMELCSIYHVDTPNVEDSFARMYSYEGDLYDGPLAPLSQHCRDRQWPHGVVHGQAAHRRHGAVCSARLCNADVHDFLWRADFRHQYHPRYHLHHQPEHPRP